MTELAERITRAWGGRLGRLLAKLALTLIIASPIGVGFWLAPKADDMRPPPEFAPPPKSGLPEALMRALPTLGQDQSTGAKPASLTSGG
jgi:hypothetical protein